MYDHITYFANAEKSLNEKGVLNPELIGFYKQVFNYLQKYYNIFKDSSCTQSVEISETLPLIRFDTISPDDELLSIIFQGLVELRSLIESYHKGINLEIMADTIKSNMNLLNDCIKSLLKRDIESLKDIADKVKLGIDELIFILLNSIKPLFIYLNDENKDSIDYKEWLASNCPFCGYYPDMAKIVDSLDGKRFLHCALCEYEWPYERLSCTVCGNKDAEKLGYFIAEDNTPYRIDYCEECKAYIKTIRLSKAQDPSRYDLYVENIITPYLDYLVLEKGYIKQ